MIHNKTLLSQIWDSLNLQGQILVFISPPGAGWPSYAHRPLGSDSWELSVGQSILVSGHHLGHAISSSSSCMQVIFRQLRVSYHGAHSLTKERVCNLQLLLDLDSAVCLGSGSAGFVTISYCIKFETSTTWKASFPWSLSYCTTEGQSASLFWCQPTIWDFRTIFLSLTEVMFRCSQFLNIGYPIWQQDGSVTYSHKRYWAFPALSFSVPRPTELQTICSCLISDWVPFISPFATRRAAVEVF
jgi:hypothetical protein